MVFSIGALHSSTGRVHHFLTGQMAAKSSSPDFVGDELKRACHEVSQIEEQWFTVSLGKSGSNSFRPEIAVALCPRFLISLDIKEKINYEYHSKNLKNIISKSTQSFNTECRNNVPTPPNLLWKSHLFQARLILLQPLLQYVSLLPLIYLRICTFRRAFM